MKKLFIIALAFLLVGCGQIDATVDSVKSATGLLNRTVTLYNADGTILKKWETDNQIEYSGSLAAFIAKDGTNVRISGTFVIEGK